MNGMDGLKRWRCKNGHVLGVVQRVRLSPGVRVTRLVLFRQAIDVSLDGQMEEVDVLANVEGTTLDVRCSACGETRSWYIGEEGMERLLRKVASGRSPVSREREADDDQA